MIWSQWNKIVTETAGLIILLIYGKIPLCLPVKQCLVTRYQFRQLEKIILRLKILFPLPEFLYRNDCFVFSTTACVNPRPPYLHLLNWLNILALSHLIEHSRLLSPYGSSVPPDTWGTFSECMRNVCALVKRLFHNFRENWDSNNSWFTRNGSEQELHFQCILKNWHA